MADPNEMQGAENVAVARGSTIGMFVQSKKWDAENPWLVVSLCDGIGGAFLALDLADLPFFGVAAEKEGHLRDFTHQHWPHLKLVKDCGHLEADDLIAQVRRHNCRT